MGLQIILAEGVKPPGLTHDGTYDQKLHLITLPRGTFVIGVGGFLFEEVSADGTMKKATNRFWLRFVDIKYIRATGGALLFRNVDLCPSCDVMDHTFKSDRKRGVVRHCRRCGREVPMRE